MFKEKLEEYKQLQKNVDKSSLKYLSIVYEPNWSIGNSEIQDVNKINKILKRIKIYVKNIYKNQFY